MKGFVRVIEAIIASIILIASISYFFLPEVRQSSWDDIVIGLQVKESMGALKKSGSLDSYVKQNNIDGINNALRKTISPNIEFSLEINNIPNPVIRISCWCAAAQADDLEKKILTPRVFQYRGRDIDIRIVRVNNPDGMSSGTNILFVFDYSSKNFNTYSATLDSFLMKGGTIFLFSDLTQGQVSSDVYLKTRFGLEWQGGTGGGAGKFHDTTDPSTPSYKIAKYYQGLRNEDPASVVFNVFSANSRIKIEDNRTVVSNKQERISFVKTNEFVNSSGRTVWLKDYDYSVSNPRVQEANNLTKAAVLWASGERFRMDTFTKLVGPVFSRVIYLSTIDGHPYRASLTFWKVFY